jgi:hypothetical protein
LTTIKLPRRARHALPIERPNSCASLAKRSRKKNLGKLQVEFVSRLARQGSRSAQTVIQIKRLVTGFAILGIAWELDSKRIPMLRRHDGRGRRGFALQPAASWEDADGRASNADPRHQQLGCE